MTDSNLKIARQLAGLTQEQVARLVGITSRAYQGYESEKNQPRVQMATKIARTLGFSVEDIWNGNDEVVR